MAATTDLAKAASISLSDRLSGSVTDILQVIADNTGGKGITAFDLERIKMPTAGNTVWMIDDEAAKAFDGVIVHWHEQRAYWPGKLGEAPTPDCSSNDGILGTGNPGGMCSSCQLAQFGSKGDGTKGQACRSSLALFVVRTDTPEPSVLPVVLSVSPASIGPVRKFFIGLATHALPYYGVVTRFSLDKKRTPNGIDYAQVSLTVVSKLTPDERQLAVRYHDSVRDMTGSLPTYTPDE